MATKIPPYRDEFDKFFSATMPDDSLGACDKLLELKTLGVSLEQHKNSYWRRWCLQDWPCPWTQHRSNIDKLKQRLQPVTQSLERECSVETNSKLAAQTARRIMECQAPNGDENAQAHSRAGGNIYNFDINIKGVKKV